MTRADVTLLDDARARRHAATWAPPRPRDPRDLEQWARDCERAEDLEAGLEAVALRGPLPPERPEPWYRSDLDRRRLLAPVPRVVRALEPTDPRQLALWSTP